MNESVENIIKELKIEYANELTSSPEGKKRNFSLAFKHKLLSEIEKNQASIKLVAEGLGISAAMISKWKWALIGTLAQGSKQEGDKLFNKLEIEAEPQLKQNNTPYLEGKLGVRIFGLSLSQMAELLRCL